MSLAIVSCTVDAPHAPAKVKDDASAKAAPAKVPTDAPALPSTAPAPTPAPPVADAAFDVRAPVEPAADAITIVDAGAEPKRALAIGGKVGDARSMKLVLELSVAMDLGTRKVPATAVPPLTVTLRSEITAADADSVTIAIAVTEVLADAPEGTTTRVRDAMTRTAERLRGSNGTMRVAKDGRVLAFDLTPASAAADAKAMPALEPELGGLSAALQELLPAAPADPVGDGARWTSIRHVKRDAAQLEQSGAWTLALEGQGARLTLESTHVATKDPAAAPSMIEAASGTTRATIVLGEGPLPARANATIETSMRANLELIGAPQRVALRTVLTLALEDLGPAK